MDAFELVRFFFMGDGSTDFPPSFHGNPAAYSLALFSLTMVSSLSLASMLRMIFEGSRRRAISRLIDNHAPALDSYTARSSLGAYQAIIFNFLLMEFLGSMPDVLFLWGWGDASQGTIDVILLMDRYCDGLCFLPFLRAIYLVERHSQSIPQQLAKVVKLGIRPLRWSDHGAQLVKIASASFFLSMGMTIAKAF